LGVHANNISRWESDRIRPSIPTLQRIAEVLEVRLEDLLAEDDKAPDAVSSDKKLVEKMQQLRQLNPEDRAVIFHIIETYAAQQRLTAMVATPRPGLEELRK
jgi:transcriptional regulator with XRE-family HTH domain